MIAVRIGKLQLESIWQRGSGCTGVLMQHLQQTYIYIYYTASDFQTNLSKGHTNLQS